MKRIAVVDDEPDITNVLKKGLERHGFAVDPSMIHTQPLQASNLSIMTL
jgi:DNA-binding response OmpR family regulator